MLPAFTEGTDILNSFGRGQNTDGIVSAGSSVLLVVTALAALDVERDSPGATITNVGNALRVRP